MTLDGEVVVLDFETTGLSPARSARITEVAALRLIDGRIVDSFVSLVNCGVRVPASTVAINGIDDRMLRNAPKVDQVLPSLVRFIGATPICAHNASFDVSFLENECRLRRIRLKLLPAICTVRLTRRVFQELTDYKLATIQSELSIARSGNAHRAESDARVTGALLLKLADRVCTEYGRNSVDINVLARLANCAGRKLPEWDAIAPRLPPVKSPPNPKPRVNASPKSQPSQSQRRLSTNSASYEANRVTRPVGAANPKESGGGTYSARMDPPTQYQSVGPQKSSSLREPHWTFATATGVLRNVVTEREYSNHQYEVVDTGIRGFAIRPGYGPDVFVLALYVRYIK